MNFLLNSILIGYLRSKGARIGKNVKFGKWPNILLRDGATLKSLCICYNVTFDDKVYIRIRSIGSILIDSGARLCKDVWLTTANNEQLYIGPKTIIGPYNILNGGHGLKIDRRCVFSSFINITTSDHKTKIGTGIMEQGFYGAPIEIGADVLIGSHVFIKQGVNIKNNAIIGAGSVVLNDVQENWIVAGNPAKFIKERI